MCYRLFGPADDGMTVQMEWSAKELAADLSPRVTGTNSRVEANLLRNYRPLSKKLLAVQRSCTVVDRDGIVLMVYLRDGITRSRQVSMHHRRAMRLLTFTGRDIQTAGKDKAAYKDGSPEKFCHLLATTSVSRIEVETIKKLRLMLRNESARFVMFLKLIGYADPCL